MRKGLTPSLLGAAVLLAGCGAAGERSGSAHGGLPKSVSDHTAKPRPTAARWPAFDVDDYTYTLRTTCFCADRGVPVIVTVTDGRATEAVYAQKGRGHAAGDDAGDWMKVTINDVIDAANTLGAYQVKVRWPDGQAYPSSVWVDRDANAADEEIGYSVRDVTPI